MNRDERRILAQQAFASAKLGRGGWFRATCPFCPSRKGTPDKRWSWGYLPERGTWHCFRCGAFGSFGGDGQASKDYRPDVIDEARMLDPELEEWAKLPPSFQLLAETKPIVDDLFGTIDPYEPAKKFLKRRGVSRALAREVGIGAVLKGCGRKNPECTKDDRCMDCRFRKRIIVPIIGPGDMGQVGFVARTWGKTALVNYLYPKGMPRGQAMFNHSAIWVETDEPIIVVEGVFDAFPYWPNAVACLGKPTDDHIEALGTAKRPIAVCLDGDAWREGKATARLLEYDGARAGYVRLPPKRDPNEIDPDWLIERARECVAA